MGVAVGRAVGCPVGIVDGDGDGRGVGSKLHWTTMFELADHPELVHSYQFPDTSMRSAAVKIYMPIEFVPQPPEPMAQYPPL